MNQKVTDDDPKFRCIAHPQYVYCALYFEENSRMPSRLLCTKCQSIAFNNNSILKRVVPLQDFLNNPAISMREICSIKEQELPNFEILQQIEQELSKLEEKIKAQLAKLKENIKYFKELTLKLNEKICDKLQLDEVVKQINTVSNQDSHQGTIQFKLLEEKLEFISKNLKDKYIESNQDVLSNFSKNLSSFQNNLKIIQDDVYQLNKDSIFEIQSNNLNNLPLNIKEELKEFPLIHKQISEGRTINYQLIYKYSIDGLYYWQKCNNQSNLLTMMTSKNGQKFGGFSPCQIVQNKNNFVQDQSMKSFIFQYNKRELYNLKVQQHAIYSHQNNGPTYGQNCDIYIAGDFKQGHTLGLGVTYDTSKYEIKDKDTHIFGDRQPNLVECKVYKVIFE
ncbi:hypothetical protein pb186bvf_003130 [Paramecium bursaria]